MVLHDGGHIMVRRRIVLVRRYRGRRRRWETMHNAVCWRIAMRWSMFHRMRLRRRRRLRSVWRSCRWIWTRCGVRGCSGRALLMRGVVGVRSVHRRRRGMAGAVVLVVCVIFRAVTILVTRWRRRVLLEGRQCLGVRRCAWRRMCAVDGRQ